MQILFICKGNINRSAIAEYILKHQLVGVEGVDVVSSGTTAAFGSWGAKATKKMRNLAEHKGVVNLEQHRAQVTTKELIESSDQVYYMDKGNEKKLKKMFGDTFIDTHCKMLCDPDEVPDPMGKEVADFELAYTMIQNKCLLISHEIRHTLERGEDLPISQPT